MTARDGISGGAVPPRCVAAHEESEPTAHVDRTCLTAVQGRLAARALAEWSKPFGLSECEFQLLWQLRAAPESGFDQTTLAGVLAFSPAQISASIERLRAQGHICPGGSATDRRRRQWRLSASGHDMLSRMFVAFERYRRAAGGGVSREVAA